MKAIRVTIGGKMYPLKADEADEQMMIDIAKTVDERFKNFRTALAAQPETTALVMTSLSFAEELYMLRRDSAANPTTTSSNGEEFAAAVRSDLEKIINSIR